MQWNSLKSELIFIHKSYKQYSLVDLFISPVLVTSSSSSSNMSWICIAILMMMVLYPMVNKVKQCHRWFYHWTTAIKNPNISCMKTSIPLIMSHLNQPCSHTLYWEKHSLENYFLSE